MDYNIWKSVLLDWVNSTGFLVQNYENLHDTDIATFFKALKKQIKSISIKSEDVISFLGDYYKDYLIRMDDGQSIPPNEYIYIYSLFMHFACIQYPDSGIQNICKNMVQKNQEIIEIFLECLIRINKCDRLIMQNAIEEAENYEISSYKSPPSRQLQSLLSRTSPQTPKTKMLNSWNLESRNLKAQLETERFERGYLEMQLNQCEKKLTKLDEDFKNAMIENHDLKKQVQSLDEMSSDSNQTTEANKVAKQFQRELSTKENEIERLTVNCNDARYEIESLKEQLAYAQAQVKSLDSKVLGSLDDIENFKNELENRDKMINYLTNNNEELTELLKELQSSKRKPDFDSSASCEMLESTSADLNSSSFYVPVEENLASSIIDIRLIDQQKLNHTLNEAINQLQNELATIQEQAFKMYSTFVGKKENDSVETSSVEKILAYINERCSHVNEVNENLSINIATQNVEIAMLNKEKTRCENELAENTTTIDVLQKSIDSLNEKLLSVENSNKELLGARQGILVELETTTSSLAICETQRAELTASLHSLKEEIEKVQSERRTETARHYDELRTLTSEYEKKIEALKVNQDALIQEQITLQSKLNHSHQELDEAKDALVAKSSECDDVTASKMALEKVFAENEAKRLAINSKWDESEKELIALRSIKGNLERDVESHETAKSKLDKQLDELTNELKNRNDLVIQLQSEKKQSDQDISELKAEIQAKVETSKEMAQNFDKEKMETKKTLNQLTAQIDDLEKVNAIHEKTEQKLSAELKKAQDEIAAKQTEITTINLTIDELNENIKSLQSEIESLTRSKSVMKQENDNLTQKYNSWEKALDDKEQEIQNLKTDFGKKISAFSIEGNILNEQIAVVNNNYEEAKKRIEILEEEQSKCLRDIVELRSSHDKECKKFEKIRDELEIASAALDCKIEEINAFQAKFNSAQQKLEQTTDTLKDVRSEMDNISSAKSALEESMAELRSSHDEETMKITEQLEKVQNELNVANAALDNKTGENSALQAKFDSVQLELEQNLNTLKDIRSEMEIISSAKSMLEESLQKSEKQVIELEKTIASNDEIERRLASELISAQEEITNKQSKFETLSIDKEKLNESLKICKEEIESLHQSKSNIEQQLNDAQQKCVSLENEIHEKQNQMETEKSELEAKVAKLIEDEKVLRDQLAGSLLEHKEAEKQIESLSQQNDKCSQEIVELNKQINTLKAELEEKSANLTSEQATKVDEIAKLESKIKGIADESVEKANQLDQSIQKMTNMEANFRVQIDELSNEKEKLTAEIESQKINLQTLNDKITEMNSDRADLIGKADSLEKKLTEARDKLNTINTEKNALVSKIVQLNRTIDEQKQEWTEEKCQLENQFAKVNEQLAAIQEEKQSLENSIEKMKAECAEHVKTNDTLKQENETFAAKVNDCAHEIEQLKVTMSNLQDENQRLIQSASNQGEVQALKEQLNQIQKQCQDRADNWKNEKEALIQDNKIYRAKLMKEREIIEKKEIEHRETRTEFIFKLEKMKEKMRTLYKEEMAKAKEKHEKDTNEAVKAENRRCNEKIEASESRIQKLAAIIHRQNEERLQLWKDYEILKTKLRSANINFQLNGNAASNMFEGGTFKMEDEEGELFDNTYLDELKGGMNKTGLPSTGRESLTLDEIKRRNSMVPPHLRSSYMPQYTNPIEEPKNDENLRSLDDSMFSTQSETRRLTLYKKPGPPTPNKNSSRLSLGASGDLARGDILREQNGNDRATVGGGGSTKSIAKKSTPGKFLSMFSSSKSKDEAHGEKENDKNLLQNLLITSTPRHSTKQSSLSRFESTNSIRLTENSFSRLQLTDCENLSQSSISKIGGPLTTQQIQWSMGMGATSPDLSSTQDTTKSNLSKKSARRRRSSGMAKKSIRLNWRKEKRQAIHNQMRNISKIEHVIDEFANRTFSIRGTSQLVGTVPSSIQSIGTNFGSEHEEIEIRNFQAEVYQHNNGPLAISTENLNVIDSVEEQNYFENVCNSKESHCPFDDTKNKTEKSLLKECIDKMLEQKLIDDNNSPFLMPSAQRSSSGIATRISSHCARICWNQQKIPQVHTYKVEKRTETNLKNRSSVSDTCSSFLTSFHTSISDGWSELPTFVQYYMIAIILCLISVIYFRINK